ncbi:hypothetical protein RND61_10285 [Streptomyces sp. TRM76323]|uniref:Uncharacterized protein n=1 Tax=Streptomyces tamarix TaxID=3078565 RepID=A0ABU3QJ02_9ACTN|nr:hypothetical protein [Streptomyces tamarix]MDT9682453.1 hypothetical protein [Streptomyces tamarix]
MFVTDLQTSRSITGYRTIVLAAQDGSAPPRAQGETPRGPSATAWWRVVDLLIVAPGSSNVHPR